jgi:hypothetical protein
MAECLHGMEPAWCSLCRKLPDPGAEPATRPLSSGPGPWFEARFPSRCACGEPIAEGDEIRADGLGQYAGRCCEDDQTN